MEPGETQEQALVREFREELGAAIEPIDRLWSCAVGDELQLYWWRARLGSFDFQPNPAEVAELRWRTYSDLWGEPDLLESNREFMRIIGRSAWRAR